MDVLTFYCLNSTAGIILIEIVKIQLIIQHIDFKERWTEHCPYHLSRLQDRVAPVATVNIMAPLSYES